MPINVGQTISDQLDMTREKKQLNLNARRIDVNTKQYHLVIGLGGTGTKALLETKGYIQLTCKNPERRVAYLAFDTSDRDLSSAMSSPETGKVRLDETLGERNLFNTNGMNEIFAPGRIGVTLSTHHEYFTWVDERLNPVLSANGAAQTRQIGRLVLVNNYDMIKTAIQRTVLNLTLEEQNDSHFSENDSHLSVYILAGISGGTGSGAFIDMPYIVRDVLSHMTNFAAVNNKILGYLFMPDVNAREGGEENLLKRNAYAALKELDYNMSILSELGEDYKIDYARGVTLHPGQIGKSIYDYIHLVSATDHHGLPIREPYKTSMRAIAQNILSFVANEQADTTDGTTAMPISSHYSNINTITEDYLNRNNNLPSRYHKYLAIGSYNYELPIDDIMMYITSLLFKEMEAMYLKDPTVDDQRQFNAQLLVSRIEQVMGEFIAKIPNLAMPPDPTYNELKNGAFDWEEKAKECFAGRSFLIRQLDEAEADIRRRMIEIFNAEMASRFKDPSKGPVYVNHLIVGGNACGDGVISAIRSCRDQCARYATVQPAAALSDHIRSYSGKLKNLKDLGIFAGKNARETRVAEVNAAGRNLFMGMVVCLLAQRMTRIYDDVGDHVLQQNTKLFNLVKDTLITLKNTFKKNADILTSTEVTQSAHGQVFHWELLSIPAMNKVLTTQFDNALNKNGGLGGKISRFVEELWSNAQDWINNETTYDPRSFVSHFVDNEFGELARMSLEDVILALLNADGGDLDQTVRKYLMPTLIQKSAPLFYPIPDIGYGSQEILISIPSGCTNIYNAANNYLQTAILAGELGMGAQYHLQKSDINNRIYAQSVGCAVPLAAYQIVWECEKAYANSIQSVGLHLVHAVGKNAIEHKSWRDLCTLIPSMLRANNAATAQVQSLIDAETKHKDLLKGMFNPDLSPIYPLVSIKRDAGEWGYIFTLTNALIDETDTTLTIRSKASGHAAMSFSMDGVDIDDCRRTLRQLADLRARGFAAALDGIACETKEFAKPVAHEITNTKVNGDRTIQNLLEEYVRHYELIISFESELVKYQRVDAWIAKINEHIDYLDRIIKELFNYTQCWLEKAIYIQRNPETGRNEGVLGQKKPLPLLVFNNNDELHTQHFALYKSYASGGQDGKYQSMIENIRQKAVKKYIEDLNNVSACTELHEEALKLSDIIVDIIDDKMINAEIYGIERDEVSFFKQWKVEIGKIISDLDLKLNKPTAIFDDLDDDAF